MFNSAEDKSQAHERRFEYRQWIIEQVGGRCSQCRFSDWRALEFHHRYHDGAEDRRRGFRATAATLQQAQRILQRFLLGELTLLCANCHTIATREEQYHRSINEYQGSEVSK